MDANHYMRLYEVNELAIKPFREDLSEIRLRQQIDRMHAVIRSILLLPAYSWQDHTQNMWRLLALYASIRPPLHPTPVEGRPQWHIVMYLGSIVDKPIGLDTGPLLTGGGIAACGCLPIPTFEACFADLRI